VDCRFRRYRDDDAAALAVVFNHFVADSFAAYPEKEVGAEFIRGLARWSDTCPFYVIETPAGETIGFGLLRPYRDAPIFRRSAELTYFLLPAETNKGIGSKLLEMLTDDAREMQIDNLVANISSLNDPSLRFHEKHGFRQCGRFESIGIKHGRSFDLVWVQKRI
jgi:L-amino acid N-acyltransferase YncA